MYFVTIDKMDRIMAQKLYAFWFLVTLMKDGVRKSEFSIVVLSKKVKIGQIQRLFSPLAIKRSS